MQLQAKCLIKRNKIMKQYTYTFIIPHHNCPILLNRCLDSIPQREDIQIIVVDDNSDEDKRPCIKRNDVEVIYIDAEHTKGAGRARNYGLKAAKGKWLLFADCDDFYAEGFLDVLDKHKDEDIEVLYFNYNYLNGGNGSIIKDNKLQNYIESYNGTKYVSDYIRYCNKTPWTKMFKNSFVRLNKMYFEEVPNGNDILFSICAGHKCRQYNIIHDRLYNYVKTSNSIVTSKKNVQEYICSLVHVLQHNYVLHFIGHKEWKNSILLHIAIYIKHYPMIDIIKLLFEILTKSKEILNIRKDWVRIITKNEYQEYEKVD